VLLFIYNLLAQNIFAQFYINFNVEGVFPKAACLSDIVNFALFKLVLINC